MKRVKSQIKTCRPTVTINGEPVEIQFYNYTAVVADQIAAAFAALESSFYQVQSEEVRPEDLGQVLLVRGRGLGDVLMLTPIIRKFAAAGAIVDVRTDGNHRALFEGNPDVRATFDTASADSQDLSIYDAIFDLSLGFANDFWRTGQPEHRIDSWAGFCDLSLVTQEDRHLAYFVQPEEKSAAEQIVAPLRDQDLVVVAYVSRTHVVDNRTWKPRKKQEVLEALVAEGYGVLVVGEDAEDIGTDHNSVLNLTGKTSVREAAALLAACDIVLTPDTGLFHLAGALDLPTMTYFGPFAVEHRESHKTLATVDAREKCGLWPCRQYFCLNREEDGQARCIDVDASKVVYGIGGLLETVNIAPPKPKQEPAEEEPAEPATETQTEATQTEKESEKETVPEKEQTKEQPVVETTDPTATDATSNGPAEQNGEHVTVGQGQQNIAPPPPATGGGGFADTVAGALEGTNPAEGPTSPAQAATEAEGEADTHHAESPALEGGPDGVAAV